MKRTRSQLNAISYSYKKEKQRYYNFLVDFCSRYCPINNERYFSIHRYKYLSTRIRFLRLYIFDFCPNFLFNFYFGLNINTVHDILNEEYKVWKKGGDKF